ncbi:cobalt-precorrin-6A reductase [Entomohabitans teleogrylli]|uniref:cobalt-precorrin-6A reductase n=1 Tax=Entomohabitans teleogrylli TaxID=1384589 RepID=UPI0008FC560B|nr:cobalt-precorrin-6A reductase [Entomohabitans teleogrylli]
MLVIGGTSDARQLCRMLDEAGVDYTLSVATPAGRQMAAGLRGTIRSGRMDGPQMVMWLREHRVRWVIDASHPYAEVVSRNARLACRQLGIRLHRYQRPGQLEVIDSPLLHRATSIEEACRLASACGPRVLLTTGSKDLARWRQGLADKTLLARVLPTAQALAQCEASGLGVEQIYALCGPFSAAFNQVFYQQCRADVVITKESGSEGGFLEKVRPCLALNIPCIVLTRPPDEASGAALLESQEDFARCLREWLAAKNNPHPAADAQEK